ncbi:MAG TPA: EutN/CcmL family microcompartment protein [Peptostreptococcaceae bacterium]|nr:EutN/CcmL family microcompartment protein [Peptostreptococcaceae bacterium]
MNIGRVIGTVVATRKDDTLVGCKLMITQSLTMKKEVRGEPIITVDTVGAGIGELIIYTEGTAARNAARKRESSIDAAIVGIVDNIDVWEE